MPLEQQVTSLELSKRLKELGVKQDSYFYHIKTDINEYRTIKHFHCNSRNSFVSNYGKIVEEYSAFTVSELGEMLPYQVDHNWLWIQKNVPIQKGWAVAYDKNGTFIEQLHYEIGSEADARAKMLIYLLENKLITL